MFRENWNDVNLIYVDESVGDGYFVVCAVVVQERRFQLFDWHSRALTTFGDYGITDPARYEFHARKLFHSHKALKNVPKGKRHELLLSFVQEVSRGDPCPVVVYGAVDQRAHDRGLFGSAPPNDVAFRCCLDGIERWILQNTPNYGEGRAAHGLSLLILDDQKNNDRLKGLLQQTYRDRRGDVDPRGIACLADCLHDDLYFGDSAYSVGIQLADVCAFIIHRHLIGKSDIKPFYDVVRPAIFYGVTVPEAHLGWTACEDSATPSSRRSRNG